MLNILYFLPMDLTYEFNSGITIPYLTYWAYDQMDL